MATKMIIAETKNGSKASIWLLEQLKNTGYDGVQI